jgi:hypothetical protein
MTVSMRELRDRLKPFNPSAADIIKLSYNVNYGYVPSKDVYDALDTLDKKLIAVAAGIDEITPLEKLAMWLLVDSAGLNQ